MSMAPAVDAGLALLILGLGLWIIAARSNFAAVVGFMTYGLMLALVWVRLTAVDVAMTEAALGAGLTGVLLLGAAARLPAEAPGGGPGAGLRVLVAVLCVGVAAALAGVVLSLPEPAPSLAPLVAENLPPTGVKNPVTGVLLAHRAIDTLLETVVLIPALIGVWALAADRAWGARPGALTPRPSSSSLTLLAQVLPPFGILVGVHLVWAGADEPGGKFQGAAVLAAMWVLVVMAGLADLPKVTNRLMRYTLVLGPLVFVAIGLAGIWTAGAFLALPAGYAKPLIVLIEVVLTLSVALMLGLLLAGPPKERA